MMAWRLWPLLPGRSIPRYLERMERDYGLRFERLAWIPIAAKYRPIHRLHAARYDVDYFSSQNAEEIQEYLDICEASGWEPVLQLDRYKIFRAASEGAVPLYTEDEERRDHWKRALRKYCASMGITVVILLAVLVWLIFFLYESSNGDFFLSVLYAKPMFQQLVYLCIVPLLLACSLGLIAEGVSMSIPWRRPLSGFFCGLGILFRLMCYLAYVMLFGSCILSAFLELQTIGGMLGVLIGQPLGGLYRTWYGENAVLRARMKGQFKTPKWAYVTACAMAIIVCIGSFVFQYESLDGARTRGEAVYIHSQNTTCSEIIYDAASPKYNQCAYELRDNWLLRKDIRQHQNYLMSAIISEDIARYSTAEEIRRGARTDRDAKLFHEAAIDQLEQELHPDEILVNEYGTRYLIRLDRRIYRLCSPIAFYDDPFPDSEEEIAQMGNEIFQDLTAQMSVLEKMFSN